MSSKVRATTRYLLIEQLKLLGQSLAALLIIFILLPLLFALVTGNISNFHVLSSLSNLAIGFIFFFFIFIISSLTYDNFKLMIQNGISRKTYWLSRVYTVLIISLLGELVSALYYYGISAPLRQLSTNDAILKTIYGLYGHTASSTSVNVLAGIGFTWIFYVGVGLTGMVVGTLLALFSKWVQRILVVTVPIVGAFLLGFIISVNAPGISHTFESDGFANFVKFIVGYPLHGDPIAGHLNPAVPTIVMLIGCVLMAALAYVFSSRLKIKN